MLNGMKRLMVTEPWEIRRSISVKVAGGEEERPLVICRSVKGVPALIAAIFSAVLESITDIVTSTPRGRWAVVAFADQVPFEVNERVPFAVI